MEMEERPQTSHIPKKVDVVRKVDFNKTTESGFSLQNAIKKSLLKQNIGN